MTADEQASQHEWQAQQLRHGANSMTSARRLPEQVDPVTWGLDRIDQASLPLDNVYHYDGVGELHG